MLPFKMKPAYKDYLWGGTRLKTGYGMEDGPEPLAESWMLSAHPDGASVAADGELAGRTLAEVWRAQPEIFGSHCAGMAEFPILIKFIDAKTSLSIQVHPEDDYARRVEGEAGKTEMWVVLEAVPGSFLYLGFEREVGREEFARRIADGTLTEVLHKMPVEKGDVVFVRSGTLHAIGAGILLAEVQQNSNSTYRVFDFGRVGPDGKARPLHVDKALDVTQRVPANPAAPGAEPPRDVPGGSLERLAQCPIFTVERLLLDGSYTHAPDGGSFVSLLCCDGAARLEMCGHALEAKKGDSLFVPADTDGFTLKGQGIFLLTTV